MFIHLLHDIPCHELTRALYEISLIYIVTGVNSDPPILSSIHLHHWKIRIWNLDVNVESDIRLGRSGSTVAIHDVSGHPLYSSLPYILAFSHVPFPCPQALLPLSLTPSSKMRCCIPLIIQSHNVETGAVLVEFRVPLKCCASCLLFTASILLLNSDIS